MLQCIHLVKEYYAGDEIVHAIRDVSVTFRDNEFVSILGPSGCGKTTLLNIIGGLDQYDAGDLIINGKSTKDYTDADWDSYRNHRIGFIFQSYNLIPHQTVLRNVELSMTLSGVSKEERRKRALDALKKVGLEDQANKKPTQMSGGQMQRVAIARALVNDPEIVLADEPTGALDSETSVQIMDLLKEVAKDRLVIMVTHNPELAEKYSTRLVRLKDGEIVSDSRPVSAEEMKETDRSMKKPSMSFLTALSLSFNNLMTKKGRTLLTSFAGSIGIIGIGLIMSLSNGVQNYIDSVERDTMASYPITINSSTMDMSVMISAMTDMAEEEKAQQETEGEETEKETLDTRPMVSKILESISNTSTNNLADFQKFIDSDDGAEIRDTAKAIEYTYSAQMSVYNEKSANKKPVQISPNGLIDRLGFTQSVNVSNMMGMASPISYDIWKQLPDSQELREDDYTLVDGRWPEKFNEVVLSVSSDDSINDFALYSLGLMDQDALVENYQNVLDGKTDKVDPGESIELKKSDVLNMEFKVIPNSDLYRKVQGHWIDASDDEKYMDDLIEKGQSVKVVGIIKPADKTVQSGGSEGVYYDSSLNEWINDQAEKSEIVKEQKKDPKKNIFTGQAFSKGEKFDINSLSQEQMMQMASMNQQDMLDYITTYNDNANATYESNLARLGVVDFTQPSSIKLYSSSFDSKEKLSNLITDYNTLMESEDKPENIISYSDTIGIMLSGVQQVINMISYVLIGFVSVSLVVSSIMIGIITYISVLERIKEIGILRAMGASKRDIRRVFNAETFIIGLASGLIGIGLTLLLDLPISLIVEQQTGVAGIASLPAGGALLLIVINLVLTMIAGLIPASVASRKNPVEALRTE